MNPHHELLTRQLRRHLKENEDSFCKGHPELLSAISDAYFEFDQDRDLLERSLEISSMELIEKNSELRAVFDAIPEVVILLNEDEKVIAFQDNDRQSAGFIYAVEKMGKYLRDILDANLYNGLHQAIENVRQSHTKIAYEFNQAPQNNTLKHYDAQIIPITGSTTLLLIKDVTEKRTKDLDILASVKQLELQNAVLLELNERVDSDEDLQDFYKKLASSVAQASAVQDVSLWFVDEKEKCMHCALHYNAQTRQTNQHKSIELKHIQNYTAALHSGRAMVVENIYEDPRAIEIDKSGTVGAFMHAPIRSSSKLLGVLKLEQPETKRIWRPDEQQFAASVADLTALIYERWERKATQAALLESEERFKILAETTEVAIFALREKFIYANPAMEKLIGYTEGELQTLSAKVLFGEAFASNFPKLSTVNPKHKGVTKTVEIEVATGNGESVWLHTNVAPAMFDGRLTWLASAFDITEQKHTEARLRYQAFHDRLTGLPNRAKLMEATSRCLEKASRDRYYRFAIIYTDIDRFKAINDSLGHLVGDQLLLEVARRLTAHVSPLDLVARIGGDEFILLIDNVGTDNDLIALAKSLQTVLSKPISINPHDIVTSASFGITAVDHNYEHAESILRDADLAMYQAKTHKTDRICLFNSGMRNAIQKQIEGENDLRNAIHNNELKLVYQPVVDFKTGKTHLFEAHVKWRTKKLIAPTVEGFTQRADETGALVPAGEWMLKTAIQQLADWQHLKNTPPISVNLSGKQFETNPLLERVVSIVGGNEASENKIAIELKESYLNVDPEAIKKRLARLHESGCEIVVDGFGNGLANCAYLKDLPVTMIKLHPSITANILESEQFQVFAKASIDLLHSFGYKVVAQGVDTRRQLKVLLGLGCDFGQGSYFSDPVDQDIALTQISHTWDEVFL